MTASGFDRLRPRAPVADAPAVTSHDTEGKRALFSSSHGSLPGAGSVVVECARCGERTVLAPLAALRAVIPSLHFAIGFGRGDDERTLGFLRRRHGSLMRCPACRRLSWVRVTVRV